MRVGGGDGGCVGGNGDDGVGRIGNGRIAGEEFAIFSTVDLRGSLHRTFIIRCRLALLN